MKKKITIAKVLKNAFTGMTLTAIAVLSTGVMNAQKCDGYIAGDFHQHTTYTDGSWTIWHVMAKNVEFGLDWWANSEHGGGFTRDAAISGVDTDTTVFWDQYTPNPIMGTVVYSGGHQVMWRWQSLKEYSFPNTLISRELYSEKMIIQGYEMNVPGHEHGGVAIIAGQFTNNPNCNALAEFEFKFDESDIDSVGLPGWVKSTLTGHDKTLEAITWLQNNYAKRSWLIPAHPERKKKYNISHFRDMNNVGPDVCIGFESMPGHQKGPQRGGYSSTADGGGTYGGCGVYAAQIGGLWDALLSEGRNFWLFASSDFHDINDDFYPGEYQKTYTYVNDPANPKAIVKGLRSGNAWVVEGDLIDELEFSIKGKGNATMGGSLKFNKKLDITIFINDPQTNNNFGMNPVLDHVDLIMGKITGEVLPGDPNYNNPTAPNTQIIARFDNVGGVTSPNGITSAQWIDLGDGLIMIQYSLNTVQDSCYFRLRGTNQGLNISGETDADGNPLLDIVGQNTYEKAISDLWFYSNPIFAYPKSQNKSEAGEQDGNLKDSPIDMGSTLNIEIYPNPASSEIRLMNIPAGEKVQVDIYNINGQLLISKLVSSNESIDISAFTKGIYTLSAHQESSEIFIKKFIKN